MTPPSPLFSLMAVFVDFWKSFILSGWALKVKQTQAMKCQKNVYCQGEKVKEESPGPLSTETKLLGHCEPILVLKSTLFHS